MKEILNALEVLNADYEIDSQVLTEMLKNEPEQVSEEIESGYMSIDSNYSSFDFYGEFISTLRETYSIYGKFIAVYNRVHSLLTAAALIVKNKRLIIKDMEYWCKKLNCKSEDIIEKFKLAEKLLINQELLTVLNYGLNNYTDIKELLDRMFVLIVNKDEEDNAKELYDVIVDKTTNEIGIIKAKTDKIAGTKKEMLLADILKLTEPLHYDYDNSYYVVYGRDDERKIEDLLKKEFIEPENKLERLKIYKKAVLTEKAKYNLSKDESGFILYDGKALLITKNTLIKNGIDPDFVNWRPIKYVIQKKSEKNNDRKIKILSKKVLKEKLS